MSKAYDLGALEWHTSSAPVLYPDAVSRMEERVDAIRKGDAPELIWCLEHPPLYTLGSGGELQDILRDDVPVFRSGRGGKATFHGPGQRVVYLLLDLSRQDQDLRAYVRRLEAWLMCVCRDLGVVAERRAGRVGLWVREGASESKIASLGIRVRRWVSYHGIALNVAPDLSYFEGIVPCGLKESGVTSLQRLRGETSYKEVDVLLKTHVGLLFPHGELRGDVQVS